MGCFSLINHPAIGVAPMTMDPPVIHGESTAHALCALCLEQMSLDKGLTEMFSLRWRKYIAAGYIYMYCWQGIYIYVLLMMVNHDGYMVYNHGYLYIYISAKPGLRQGRGGAWDHRRCGTCFVIALCSWGIQACRLPGFKRLKLLKPSKSLAPPATKPLQTLKALTTLQLLRCFLAAAATKPSGRQPLLFQGCSLPFACTSLAAHQAPGRQRSSIAACPLPAHSPLLLRHSSLPFARLKALKALKALQLPRGSFQEALWPSAFAVPGLQPALCLHIPRGSFHQAPGRQRSSIAACPLPAHSPLLLRHSSLPFARLQTLKTLKTLQLPRGSFHLQLLHCFLAAAATKPSGRQPLLFQGCSLPFACTSLAAASTKPSGRQPLLFQGCSLPFACT